MFVLYDALSVGVLLCDNLTCVLLMTYVLWMYLGCLFWSFVVDVIDPPTVWCVYVCGVGAICPD